MNMHATSATVLGALAVLALSTGTANAQGQMRSGTNELHLFTGYLFGDDLTDAPVTPLGPTPELDDDWLWGLRYGYNFSEMWGIDISAGWSPNSATNLVGGDIDLDVTLVDVSAIWHFTPQSPVVGYTLAGVGYAFSDLDTTFPAIVDGVPIRIDDDDGFTLNAGIGAKWFVSDTVMIRGEARYRYIDKLVDELDDSLNTFDVTLGVGWQF